MLPNNVVANEKKKVFHNWVHLSVEGIGPVLYTSIFLGHWSDAVGIQVSIQFPMVSYFSAKK